jgi:putative phage-type endonuclease
MSTELTGAPAPLDLTKISREEWLASRKLGASDCAAILGINPFRTPYDVFAEKVGLKAPFEGNEATRFGQKLEPVIAAEYAERTGHKVFELNVMLTHPVFPFITATPDRGVEKTDGRKGLGELKNTGAYFAKHWEEKIPDAAHVQAQQQLMCSPCSEFTDVVALIGGNKLVWHEVLPDAALQARITELLCEFWERVLTKTPPPMVAEDAETIKRIFPTSQAGLEIALPAEAEQWIEMKAKADEALKSAKSQKDLAEANLKRLMGNAERGTFGKKIVSWKSSEVAGFFVAPRIQRTFSIKEAK